MLAKKLSMTLEIDGVPRYFTKKVPRYRYSVPSTDGTGTDTKKVPRYFSTRYSPPMSILCLQDLLSHHVGILDANLEFLEVGGLNHSRWLTLRCRILQFYVAQEKPTSNLSTLAEFLLKVYFPGWFQI